MKPNEDHKKHIQDMLTARSAILEDLKRRFKDGDKGVKPNERWSTPYGEEDKHSNHFSGVGKMPCPVCESGVLHYSRAAYNGHVHAKCSTDGCVCWME